MPFLRFILFPTHRRLKRRKGIAFRRRLKDVVACYAAGELDRAQVMASVLGWVNHARYGDTWGLRRAILNEVLIPVRRP